MSITKNTAVYVNNPNAFCSQIDELKYDEVFPRIESWLTFFNANYIEYILSYSYSVFAMLELAKEYPLFADQTKYEQELSFEFIKKTMRFSPHFGLSDKIAAKYFLCLSVLYGRYHGMIIQSTTKALGNFSPTTSRNQLKDIFEFLFIKFENPRILSDHLEHLNLQETTLMMYVLQGKNPRTFRGLPFPISKRESHFFITLQLPNINVKQDFLKKTIVISKLATFIKDTSLLSSFLHANHYFNFRIDEFYTHLSFWKSAFNFLIKIDWNETDLDMAQYVDYFLYKSHNEKYTLKGRTFKSVTDAINRWHQNIKCYDLPRLKKLSWGKPEMSYFLHENVKYKFLEITNGKRLFQESEKMNHCAISYISMCETGSTSVWSVSKPVKAVYIPFITLEIRNMEIIQAVRKNNQKVSKKELELIVKWASLKEIVVSV